jgi:hypothetical protein
MTLLFGQLPQNGFALGQFVLHALVGSVGDVVIPPVEPPVVPPHVTRPSGDDGRGHPPAYVLRDQIWPEPPATDDEVAAAIAVFLTIENDSLP